MSYKMLECIECMHIGLRNILLSWVDVLVAQTWFGEKIFLFHRLFGFKSCFEADMFGSLFLFYYYYYYDSMAFVPPFL